MSNNKPTYTIMSGSYTTTMNNVVSSIRTVAGNIITPMSGSSVLYAPYVPLQTTWLTSPTKSLPSINLHCNNGKEKIYQFAIGKSYEFLFNYMKAIKDLETADTITENLTEEEFRSALERHVYKFTPYNKLFITEITEECSPIYYKTGQTGNINDDYHIKFACNEKQFIFTATEIIDMLDQQIIRELP
ncbi:hypothetical protein EBR43_12565 [bacterium]|nr:hypothetical protein [bacterium]